LASLLVDGIFVIIVVVKGGLVGTQANHGVTPIPLSGVLRFDKFIPGPVYEGTALISSQCLTQFFLLEGVLNAAPLFYTVVLARVSLENQRLLEARGSRLMQCALTVGK